MLKASIPRSEHFVPMKILETEFGYAATADTRTSFGTFMVAARSSASLVVAALKYYVLIVTQARSFCHYIMG